MNTAMTITAMNTAINNYRNDCKRRMDVHKFDLLSSVEIESIRLR